MIIKRISQFLLLSFSCITCQVAISAVGEIKGNKYFVELIALSDVTDLNTYSLGIDSEDPSVHFSQSSLSEIQFFYVISKQKMSDFLGYTVKEETHSFNLKNGNKIIYLLKNNQVKKYFTFA